MGIAETLGLGHRVSNCSAQICQRRDYLHIRGMLASERPLAHMQEGRTPLHHASQAGKEAAVAALLEAKADVNSTDKVRRIAIG